MTNIYATEQGVQQQTTGWTNREVAVLGLAIAFAGAAFGAFAHNSVNQMQAGVLEEDGYRDYRYNVNWSPETSLERFSWDLAGEYEKAGKQGSFAILVSENEDQSGVDSSSFEKAWVTAYGQEGEGRQGPVMGGYLGENEFTVDVEHKLAPKLQP